MRLALLPLILVAGNAVAQTPAPATQVPAEMPASEILNYKRIRPDLAIAGAPTAATVARLRELGFRTVVDLRTAAEDTAAEKQAVEALGLTYVSVPLPAASFSLADAEAVRKALAAPDAGPVLLHCASANRAGGVYAVLRRLAGEDLEEALDEGRTAGLQSGSMLEATRRVAGEAAEPRTSAPDHDP
jgi:uncharacterized protein (TIGR01244 family)